ncbi:MAG: hypothetical protein R6V01_01475 [Thermoplasmatota archaeon]
MLEQKKVTKISNELQSMMDELEEDIELLGGEELIKEIDGLKGKEKVSSDKR